MPRRPLSQAHTGTDGEASLSTTGDHSLLRRNIVSNYVGQAWVAVMGLAFIPQYVLHLGVESYGLIGVYSLLQSALILLDFGITPTLTREFARYTAGAHSPQSIADLFRTLEPLSWSIAVVTATSIWLSSASLARSLMQQSSSLDSSIVSNALSMMALVVALRFVEAVYRGALFGLQRHVWFNVANAVFATLRHGAVVVVLAYVSATIEAFFAWQAAVSLLAVVVLGTQVHCRLPTPPAQPKFSLAALASVQSFAGGMFGITALSLGVSQVDKALLLKLVPLSAFGLYTLAANVAAAISVASAPISQALFPRFVELVTLGDGPNLVRLYHRSAQVLSVLTAPIVVLLVAFSEGFLYAWSGDHSVAGGAAPILTALSIGTFLNATMRIPYQLQLAHGWTSLALKTNAVALLFMAPGIYLAVTRFGARGAAWMWVLLNAGYVIVSVQFMHRRLIATEKWRWYVLDLLSPTVAGGAIVLMASFLQPSAHADRWTWVLFLLATGVTTTFAAALGANEVRAWILRRVLAPAGG